MRWLKQTVAIAALVSVGISGTVSVAPAQDIGPPPRPSLADRVAPALPDDAVAAAFPAETPIPPETLDTLVAPVALYPDALLAQVLVAATYPLQIVKADRLLAQSESMSDDELTEAISAQDWDPSVLVLATGFPTVVERMAEDLDWTEQLGAAMVAQDEDVLAAVQRMRADALDTGYLASNDAQVVDETEDEITIRPADPEVVYVPRYDPALAYTQPVTAAPVIQSRTSLFANPLVAGAMAFGAALLVTEVFGDDDDDDSWNGYWRRPQPIDWNDRQFYPRPRYHDERHAWSHERDRAWDASRRSWRPDRELVDLRAAERREALAHLSRDREARAAHLRDLRRAAAEANRDQAATRQKQQAQAAAAAREKQQAQAAALQKQQAQAAAKQKQQAQAQAAARKKQEAQKAAAQTPAAQAAAKQKQAQAAAKQKQQAQAAAKQKQQAQAQAAAKQKQQAQAQAAAKQKQQAQAQAAAKQKQQAQAQAAAKQKQQARAQAAAKQKQQAQAQAAAKQKQQAQAQAAAKQKQQAQAQAAAKQKQQAQAQAAAKQKQQAQARKAKPCRDGKGANCPRG